MIQFFVPGIPVPKGSAKAFVVKTKEGQHKAVVTQDNSKRQKPWASSISCIAFQTVVKKIPFPDPVRVDIVFQMPRPQWHYRKLKSGTFLREDAPKYHTSKSGDKDKLERCVLDALTNIAYDDDCQVAAGASKKIYHEQPGAWIRIEELPK